MPKKYYFYKAGIKRLFLFHNFCRIFTLADGRNSQHAQYNVVGSTLIWSLYWAIVRTSGLNQLNANFIYCNCSTLCRKSNIISPRHQTKSRSRFYDCCFVEERALCRNSTYLIFSASHRGENETKQDDCCRLGKREEKHGWRLMCYPRAMFSLIFLSLRAAAAADFIIVS